MRYSQKLMKRVGNEVEYFSVFQKKGMMRIFPHRKGQESELEKMTIFIFLSCLPEADIPLFKVTRGINKVHPYHAALALKTLPTLPKKNWFA